MLEDLSPQQRKDSPLVTEACGKSFYKCPMVHCARFEQGFLTRKLRDEHVSLHERAYKCMEDSCDYSTIGFPSKAGLVRHSELCHRPSSEEYTFPYRKRTSLNNALKDAIDKDDVFAVREICMEMSACPIGETGFLFRAVKRKSFDAAFVLLELLGPDELYHMTREKRTVLHEAVQAMHMGLLERILGTDADIDAQDSFGRTPLLLALENTHFDAVRLLLNHAGGQPKPTIHRRNERIWKKGFIGAASNGYHDLVREIISTLVEHFGYRSHQLSSTVSQALTEAVSNDHEQVVRVLLKNGANINAQCGSYGTALQAASSGGHEKVVQTLLDNKADVNAESEPYGTALQAASSKGHEKVVQMLLDNKADVNAKSKPYGTALQAASSEGHDKTVQILLDNRADVNAKGESFGTALQFFGTALQAASSRGHEKVVQKLLDNGADVNAQDGDCGTVLQAALSEGHDKTVQILLDNRADVNAKGEFFDTVLQFFGTALQAASSRGHEKVVQTLLNNGANINAQCGYYGIALQAASSGGHDKAVRMLLDNGANINAQCEYYGIALQVASSGGHNKAVQTLLDNGADINAQYGYHGTAWQEGSLGGYDGVEQMLLDDEAIDNAQGQGLDRGLYNTQEGYEYEMQVDVSREDGVLLI